MNLIVDPRNIQLFVLDEADEMLSRGFKDQIYDVFRFMPQSIQVLTFSVYFYFLKKNCFLQF